MVSDLQTNIVIGTDSITGTLKHVSGYIEFSSLVDEQSGNYIALKIATDPTIDVVTTIEVVGGTSGPVTLDSDMNAVLKISDNTTQSIRVVSTKEGYTMTKTYSLTDLVLETT